MNRLFVMAVLLASCPLALAGEAAVLDVDVSCNSDSICRFDVTLKRGDEGWKHYANRWEGIYRQTAARVIQKP